MWFHYQRTNHPVSLKCVTVLKVHFGGVLLPNNVFMTALSGIRASRTASSAIVLPLARVAVQQTCSAL